ncbi:hypothetical protein PFISCL1PPCAC_19846 [Pristionchus fissidentatus]|uniref:Protein CASC3 n=1 Tax=Pristionchus fissidentatus TaxID=1538716 RepID=A0AAV5W991_9BILA|nr:hypothetical protein PFISCL1PPCAC_19846 [Pristionchus fissidentatus]
MTSEEKIVPPTSETIEGQINAKSELLESNADTINNSVVLDLEVDEKISKDSKVGMTEQKEEGLEIPEDGEGGGAADEDKLDDDQDIENPAYIPKTGKYYMHDSRDDNNAPFEQKKSRADGKWSRDRFDERYQQPRSRKQLVEKYGFDIRLGETKEIVDEKEKEMRDAGLTVDDNAIDKTERIEKCRKGRDIRASAGNGSSRYGRGQGYHNNQRRLPRLEYHDEKECENGETNDEEEDIKPASRRDMKKEEGRARGSFTRGGGRNDGKGPVTRQFNRTFNNSARTNGVDENRIAPKRYSSQRGETSSQQIPSSPSKPADIVYFDPAKQISRENNAAVREKKPLDIVPPPS